MGPDTPPRYRYGMSEREGATMRKAQGTRLVACLFVAWAASLAQADTVNIKVDKTATPGEFRVFWTGGTPTFTVYESPSPVGVTNPANQLGTTSASEWLDAPVGTISYYVVTTPCLAEPPATCCTVDDDCLGFEFCKASTGLCTPTYADGDVCVGANECSSGECTDDVCCGTPCGDTCTACDQAGLEGSCAPLADGTDPDAECPGVSCTGFYWGWVGDSCRRRADVSAAQTACDGAGGCRTAAQECGTAGQGPVASSCNAQCQDPTAGTCTGTTPGACTNVNPGNQTCGLGACQVTVPQCSNGAPQACVPNQPTSETCNGIDDNCDGTLDNSSAFVDGLEGNDVCAASRLLNAVGEGQQLTVSPTLYPSGDVDIYRINTIENSGTCACCDLFCSDEDFRLIATLTVPVGAGSYEFCIAKDACPGSWANCQTIVAGASNSWTFTYDGACGSPDNDGASFYVRIRGLASPGFKCNTYSLQYRFEQGCF